MKNMQTKDKTEEIRKACIKANDEIAEGSEILYRCNRVWEAWEVGTMSESDFEEVEIDRPLHLEDILLAIEKAKTGFTIMIDSSGQWYALNSQLKLTSSSGYQNRKYNWDFGKSFEDQSPETIDFIHGLLHD